MTDLLRILVAPLAWLASFTAIYALHGLLCGFQVEGVALGIPLPRVLLVSAYALAILLQVVLLTVLYRSSFLPSSAFAHRVSHATGWTGLVAAIWSLVPAAMATYCN